MSTQYGGKAANITGASPLTITGVSAGATPTITVSGTLPATFLTGVTVDITGVQGATGANGTWVATVTGASTFTIPASAPGSYTTGGSAQSLDLGTYATPNDGDNGSAASVDVALSALGDRTAFLAAATGVIKIERYFWEANDLTDFSTSGTIAAPAAGSAWSDWTGLIASLMPFVSADGAKVYVQPGDIVRAAVRVSFQNAAANSGISMLNQIWYSVVADGASPIFNRMPGASATLQNNGSVLVEEGLDMSATVLISSSGVFDFKIRMMPNANTVGNVLLIGGFYAEAIVYRATNMPQ